MKIPVMCAMMLVCATSAFGYGTDLTVGACPGGAGASGNAGSLDCAGGGVLTLLGTFAPSVAMPDLAGIDFAVGLVIDGNTETDAGFWDFGGANAAAVSGTQARSSAPGCSAYTDAWSPSGSGFASLGAVRGPNIVRVVGVCYRQDGLAVLMNQKIWGFEMTFDASTSAEAGGAPAATGCSRSVCIVLNVLTPRAVSGNDDPFQLASANIFGSIVVVNSGATSSCFVVPTRKHTWGQLKSLYR